ncbi:MAG: NADP(H)-dependent aldo-keto reductase [Alphaproteobacteria bacterium]
MEFRKLGRTDLDVSVICLGTMTWGEQNTEAEGHEQMDYAVDQGINFFDTAELYAVPPSAGTYGRTEEVIGTWFKARGKRDDIILASKVAGYAPGMTWIRGKDARLDRANIKAALDASLKRMQTDYIDLYQLHWPDRPTNRFGVLDYRHDADARVDDFAEVISALDDAVKAGKIRHWGLSNETPWGLAQYLELANQGKGPRPVSVQNVYNLLNRSYEIGMAEMSIREDCGLLAYSPLAGGTLSGKYLNGQMPAGSRRALDDRGSRYDTPRGEAAVQAYKDLAEQHGLRLDQMSIAFTVQQPFLISSIIGATTMEQLKQDIAAKDIVLDRDVLMALDEIHNQNPNPCP